MSNSFIEYAYTSFWDTVFDRKVRFYVSEEA